MLVPALYVAAEAARRAAGAYDVHIMAEEGELDGEHRRWMAARGIEAIAGLDFSHLRRITITNTRLTPATLHPPGDAGEFSPAATTACSISTPTPRSPATSAPLFKLDLDGAALAAVPACRVAEIGGARRLSGKRGGAFPRARHDTSRIAISIPACC